MNKEKLALALIIVCIVGAIIGLIGNLKDEAKSEKALTKTEKDSKFIKMLTSYDKIAVITLAGVIADIDTDSDIFFSTSPAAKARKYINKATKDDTVKAVILRVNSPGGTVGASQEIYSAILRCRKKKPVVISMGDIAASGGYYVAAAGDYIIANPGTLTGSIGVILNAINFTDLMDKIGVKSNVVKSGKFKDIASAYRPMSEAERELLQSLINDTYNQFVDDIIEARVDMLKEKADKSKSKEKIKLTVEVLKANADGRILTGEQALQVGLVDELGDLYKAKEVARKLAQKRFKNVKDDIPVENYDRPRTFSEFLTEISNKVQPKAALNMDFPFSVQHPNVPLWVME
jgi:protease-4